MTETQPQDIVYALAASPDFPQDGLCFCGKASGLYRSDDGGQSWHFAYDSLNLEVALPTMAVALSPDFANNPHVFAGVPGGLLRSIDGGQNWEPIILPAPPPHVASLAISPNFARDGTIMAGTIEDGALRSTDGGRHWTPRNFGLLDFSVVCMVISPNFAGDNTLFVGTESGIYRSKNGGLAWREVDFPLEFAPVLSLACSPNYAEDGTLFAGTEQHGLFRSTDRGKTWARLAEAAISGLVNTIILSPDFAAKPHILVLTDALLISRDGGQTWSAWEVNLPGDGELTTVIAPQGLDPGAPLLLGLADGRVLRV